MKDHPMKIPSHINQGVRVALMAASIVALTGTTLAQNLTIPEIRVQASGVLKKQLGQTSSGSPIEATEVTVRISYADLYLDTNSGRALLKDRVKDAAKEACRRATAHYPMSTLESTDDDCVKAAVHGAQPQVDAVIAAANAPKSRLPQ
jgi:UrcA family protein